MTVVDDNAASAADANGKDLVVISSSVSTTALGNRLRDVTVPVVTWEEDIYDDMNMTSEKGSADGQIYIRVTLGDPFYLPVFEGYNQIAWGKPSASAIVAATLAFDASKATMFGYERGAQMVGLTPRPAASGCSTTTTARRSPLTVGSFSTAR